MKSYQAPHIDDSTAQPVNNSRMNRAERGLLAMAVVFTVLSSFFTHLCRELYFVNYFFAKLSGIVAFVMAVLGVACLDMWRMSPAASHNVKSLLTQYLRMRGSTFSATMWLLPTPGKERQKTATVTHAQQRQFNKALQNTIINGSERGERIGRPSNGYYEQYYSYRTGAQIGVPTLRRIGRLRKITDMRCKYNPHSITIQSDNNGFSLQTDCDTRNQAIELKNESCSQPADLDYEFKEETSEQKRRSEESPSVDTERDLNYQSADNKCDSWTIKCKPEKCGSDILYCQLKVQTDHAAIVQNQATLFLLEPDLGVLQAPDVFTLVDFFSYISQNSSSLCKKIRKHCRATNSLLERTRRKTSRMENLGHGLRSRQRAILPGQDARDSRFMESREVALRAALRSEVGVVFMASRIWPTLRLVSVLRWDPASQSDLTHLRATYCRGLKLSVSVWLPQGGVWGQVCSGCALLSHPTFRLRAHDGHLEYFRLGDGRVYPMQKVEPGDKCEPMVTITTERTGRRTGHVVQVVRVHNDGWPCFKVLYEKQC